MGRERAWQARVRFGATDAAPLLTDLTVNESIEELSSAELELELDPAFGEPIELLSEVVIAQVHQDGGEEPIFTGHVVESAPDGSSVRMRLRAGVVLTERTVPPTWTERLTASEVVYTTARDAGLPDERLFIQGLDELFEEIVEVTVPIIGLELNSRVHVGDITFLPASRGLASIAGADVPDQLARLLAETPVHAVFITRARLLRNAEKMALEEVDVILGWLRVQAHYGLVQHPSGRPQTFTRERMLAHPRRGEVVVVRGLETRRRWIRVPEDRTVPPLLRLDEEPLPPTFPAALTVAERQALIACRRAAGEQDAVTASTALSDALEFYAAGVPSVDMFEGDELEKIKNALPQLAPEKRKVVADAVMSLNNAPLKMRVIEAAARDSAPLTTEEVSSLWRVRRTRNKAVHGKRLTAPTDDELAVATSIVARLLAFRADRRLRDPSE